MTATNDEIFEALRTWDIDPHDPDSIDNWKRLTARRDVYAVLRTINREDELGYSDDELMNDARAIAAWIDNDGVIEPEYDPSVPQENGR